MMRDPVTQGATRASRWRSPIGAVAVVAACAVLLSGCFLRSIVGFVDDGGGVSLSGNLEVGFCNFDTTIPEFFGCSYTIRDERGFVVDITSTFQLISEQGVFGAIIDPLVLQVPADASSVVATYNNAGSDEPLVVTDTTSFPVTPGVMVQSEPGTKFLILELPDAVAAAIPPGGSDFDFALSFDVGDPANLVVKPMLTARVDDGGTSYYVPTLPCVTDFAQVPELQVPLGVQFQDLRLTIAGLIAGNPQLACDQVVYDFVGGPPAPKLFVPVSQARLVDTRPVGKVGNAAGTGAVLSFNVLGEAGVPVSGVDAVSLSVTADRGEQPTVGGGFVTVYDCGVLPTASNINFPSSFPVSNAVITPVSASGEVCVYVYGTADVLVDINGYMPAGSKFMTMGQARLVDTRPVGKVGNAAGTGAVLSFNVLGEAGVPVSGVDAVSLSVTADRGEQPTVGGGFVTVYDCGVLPTASNINFPSSFPVSNAVITPVSASGEVCVYVYGTADVLVDINGYLPSGSGFGAVSQARLVDTRPVGKVGNAAGTGAVLSFNVLGEAGVPVSGVDAVSLSVTADRGEQPTVGGGFVTVYDCGVLPTASNINFPSSFPVSNAVITPVSASGEVCVYVYGTADVLVDINGWFPS